MSAATRLTAATLAVLVVGAALRLAPGAAAAGAGAFVTDLCLLAAAIGASQVARRQTARSAQRRAWAALAAATACFVIGLLIVTYFFVTRAGRIPFPSAADGFLVVGLVFGAGSLLAFALTASRSDLPLGGWLPFWSPAMVMGGVALLAAVSGIPRVWRAGGTPAELALKLLYPMLDFTIVAAAAVLVRVGLKFRGGRLLRTWLPIALGASAVCVSDIVLGQLQSAGGELDISGVIDALYFVGSVGLCYGILNQGLVLRPHPQIQV